MKRLLSSSFAITGSFTFAVALAGCGDDGGGGGDDTGSSTGSASDPGTTTGGGDTTTGDATTTEDATDTGGTGSGSTTAPPPVSCEELGWGMNVPEDEAFMQVAGTYTMAPDEDCSTDNLMFLSANTYELTIDAAAMSITLQHEGGEDTKTWDGVEDAACSREEFPDAVYVQVGDDQSNYSGVHDISTPTLTMFVKDGTSNPDGCTLMSQ